MFQVRSSFFQITQNARRSRARVGALNLAEKKTHPKAQNPPLENRAVFGSLSGTFSGPGQS